jgi:hypothetical protein
MKQYLDFYPSKIAKNNDFVRHLKNKQSFEDYCLGKNEWFYKDEGNYGYERNIRHLSENEFNLWTTWINTGRNIFDLSEELLLLLQNTDVSQVELDFIKLPYQFFYLDISEAKIPFADNYGSLIEGIFISEDYNEMKDDEITYEKTINFHFTGDYINHFKFVNKNLYNHVRGFNSYYLMLDKVDGLTNVKEAVKYSKNTFASIDAIQDLDADTRIDLYKIHSDFIDRTIRLVINCLLYLTLSDRDIKEEFPNDLPSNLRAKILKGKTKHQKEVATNEIKLSGFTKIKYVGTSFKDYSKSDAKTGTISTHWRRGHWRNQKIGKELQDKKLVWIMPTIVNKDKGEPAFGHIYQVEPK